MLIRFNVKNVYSFSSQEDGASEEFSMIAGKGLRNKKEHLYDDGSLKLLKFAAIYGANAAGKSNIVKAMDFMRQTVVLGLPDGHTEKYCKIKAENKNEPSYFEIEVKLGNRYYAYGFEVILNQSKFISEWLVELQKDNSEKEIFHRDILSGEWKTSGELNRKGLREKVEVYADDIKNDSSVLFLSIMNQNKKTLYEKYKSAYVLQRLYCWLKDDFDISFPDQSFSDYSYLRDSTQTEEICRLISAFGTGITDFEMVEVSLEKVLNKLPSRLQKALQANIERDQIAVRNTPKMSRITAVLRSRSDFFVFNIDTSDEVKCQTIKFSHGAENTLFGLSEESDGTVRILDLLEILFAGEGKTYVIDELDRCLHPSLSYKFVETFFKVAESRNIQLIVTTHESRLMDFDLLRRDEIWFVNKRPTGESDIYSLDEYNTRFDQKIDKAYLEGRYGGVPIFSTIFPIEEG